MTKSNNSKNGPEFDKEVYEALRAVGWIFPETPAEVEQIEQELAKNPVGLPESLSDAAEVFDMIHLPSGTRRAGQVLHLPQSDDVRSNLARAAREGSDIAEDLAERMQQDRRKAEDLTNGQ